MEKMVEVWSLERKSSVLALREARDTTVSRVSQAHKFGEGRGCSKCFQQGSRELGCEPLFACPYSITRDSEVRHM